MTSSSKQGTKMSLNTAHANGGVLIYGGERILIFYDGVEMGFDVSSSMPHFKGNKKGRVYLTTHRVIFNNKSSKDTLQSFSIPFFSMKEVELEQPVFGANYIKGKVKAEQNGNWEGDGKFKMWFNNGGAIDFGRAMLQAGRLASRNAPAQPPVYSAPTCGYYQAPPPAYSPPQGPMYGFVPTNTFPSAPPADGVYMYEAPPPYPGIDPNLAYPPPPAYGGQQGAPPPQYPPGAAGGPPPQQNGYPQPGGYPPQPAGYPPQQNGYPQPGGYPPQQNGYPPQQNGNLADAKAAEAAASAYYNPQNPGTVYMPQQQPPVYGSAPPSYDEAAKKKDQ